MQTLWMMSFRNMVILIQFHSGNIWPKPHILIFSPREWLQILQNGEVNNTYSYVLESIEHDFQQFQKYNHVLIVTNWFFPRMIAHVFNRANIWLQYCMQIDTYTSPLPKSQTLTGCTVIVEFTLQPFAYTKSRSMFYISLKN